MSTATFVSTEVHDFSAAVRAALSDLTEDEIEDLTDGLEGDLTEQAEEAGEGYDFGDPIAYAEELRLAAGLPPRSTAKKAAAFDAEKVGRAAADIVRKLRSRPLIGAALDFLVALRPVWWVLRGWVMYRIIVAIMSGSISTDLVPRFAVIPWVLLLLSILLSVQWGRGRWAPVAWLQALRTFVSVVAVIMLPVFLGLVINQLSNTQNVSSAPEYLPYFEEGLVLNGAPVENLFAYDAEGQPLTDVQIFTQDGEPLVTVANPQQPSFISNLGGYILVPNSGVPGRTGWNIFPLNQVGESALTNDGGVDASQAAPVKPPFPQVQPLAQDRKPDPTPVPSPPAAGPESAEGSAP